MLDGQYKPQIEARLAPIGKALQRIGLRADHLTVLGVTMAVCSAVAIASGRLWLGLALLVLAGIPDALDGAIAKATNTASLRGAYFDSVADRLTDGLLLGGVAWYLADTEGGRWPLLPAAIYLAASLISYQRAKADALGFDARGGLMERAERIVVLGFGLAFSSILIPILWIMLGLSIITAIQRFAKVWTQAEPPPVAPRTPRNPRRTRSALSEQRLARRQARKSQSGDTVWQRRERQRQERN